MARAKKSVRKSPHTYHHGDLKAALVVSATNILRRDGPQALTLRAVAKATGVSATAPYRHFADRRALIAAVAEEGFRSLQQVMLQSMQQADGRRGLKGVALAYVRFAHENPAVYRVMFGPEVANNEDLPSLRETGRSVLHFVGEGIRQLQKSGLVGPGNPDLMAAAIWASLHGLVMLSLDGQTAGVAALDALTEEATRIMMFGMAAR